jgi:hypothetical protein
MLISLFEAAAKGSFSHLFSVLFIPAQIFTPHFSFSAFYNLNIACLFKCICF